MKPSQRHENGHVLELGLLLDIRDRAMVILDFLLYTGN